MYASGSAAASAPASARRQGAAARARRPGPAAPRPNALSFNEVNLGRLQSAIDAGRLDAAMTVDAASLLAAGLIGKPRDGVRLLGKGVLTSKIAITVNHASRSATEAVEKAGGTVSLIPPKRPAMGGEAAAGAGKG